MLIPQKTKRRAPLTVRRVYGPAEMDHEGVAKCAPIDIVIQHDTVTPKEAAQIARKSARQIQYLCDIGVFKTAYKRSGKRRGSWMIARSEVAAYAAAFPRTTGDRPAKPAPRSRRAPKLPALGNEHLSDPRRLKAHRAGAKTESV